MQICQSLIGGKLIASSLLSIDKILTSIKTGDQNKASDCALATMGFDEEG